MSDVRDMLGIGVTAAKKEARDAGPRKRSSLPRELQGLRSDFNEGIEDLIETTSGTSQSAFKEQFSREIRWKRLKIESSARKDNLALYHWVKIYNVPDYRFAIRNRTIKMLSFTDDEYDSLLQNDAWTRAQT